MEAFPFRALPAADDYQEISRLPVCILLDRVRSLHNVGSFFRTADAAGAARLYLTGYTGRPPHPGIAKTALGAEQSVPWGHYWDPVPLLQSLREQGHQIAAVETTLHSIDLYDWRPLFPLAVVFGNEVDGVAPEISALADVHVRIPMLGRKQSLNVSVSGGVVMYELLRKYRRLNEGWRRQTGTRKDVPLGGL